MRAAGRSSCRLSVLAYRRLPSGSSPDATLPAATCHARNRPVDAVVDFQAFAGWQRTQVDDCLLAVIRYPTAQYFHGQLQWKAYVDEKKKEKTVNSRCSRTIVMSSGL